jgi:hypothetical protein
MVSNRQLLINKIFANGIGLTGVEIDKFIKMYNNFQMPLGERIRILVNDDYQFNNFLNYILKNCNL